MSIGKKTALMQHWVIYDLGPALYLGGTPVGHPDFVTGMQVMTTPIVGFIPSRDAPTAIETEHTLWYLGDPRVQKGKS